MKLMKKIFIPIFVVVGFFAFSKNVNAANVPEYIGSITAKSEIVTETPLENEVHKNVAKLEFKALKDIYYMTVDFSVTSNSGFEDSTIYSIDSLASSFIDLSAPTGQEKSDMYVNDIAAAYTSVTVESATADAFKYATIVIEGTDYYIETIVYDIVNNSVVSVNKKFDKVYYVIDKIYEDYEFDTNSGSSEEISFCKYISTDPYIYKEFKLKIKDI